MSRSNPLEARSTPPTLLGALDLMLPALRIKSNWLPLRKGVKRWISARNVTVATIGDGGVIAAEGAAGIAAGGATAKGKRY
jgi:hypothetical protein